MITNIGLKQLGFTDADYLLQDDGDGVVYIAKWKSKERSQPTEAEIETAESEWQAEYDSQGIRKSKSQSISLNWRSIRYAVPRSNRRLTHLA
jgi:hypothetical protein